VDRPWLPKLPSGPEPIYARIVDAIRRDIRSGALRPGHQLPTHRALAKHLGVTVSTVTQAYTEATRQHLVHGQVGRGTFVLGDRVDAELFRSTFAVHSDQTDAPTSLIDLSSNVPASLDDDTDLQIALRHLTNEQLETTYPSIATLARGQAAIADFLRGRSVEIRDSDVVLCAGAQQALLSALIMTAGAAGRVLVEQLTFPGMKSLARHLGLQLVPVRTDGEGLLPDDLRRAARRSGAKTLVCVPSLQNPTASIMTKDRRKEVAAVIEREGIVAIEDDVYGPLQDEPALWPFAPNHVIVISGFSKSVAPGLRIGAIAGTHPAVRRAAEEVSLTSWTVSPVMIRVCAQWVADGTAQRRVAQQRSEISERCRIARSSLGSRLPMTTPDSPHLWLPTQTDPEVAVARLRDAGVMAVASTSLATSGKSPKGIRISVTAAASRSVLHQALIAMCAAPIRYELADRG
jgi:DNA-binding transcriptional MocR family regulator